MTKDTEIESRFRKEMNALADDLDEMFNGEREANQPKRIAFVLLVTEFGNMKGRVNYISNGHREDIVVMLKEVVARFEGQPEQSGTA